MKKYKIFLTGMMGSGKSTIGKNLAKQLGYTFFDLDENIELLENQKIEEIFKIGGENYFREKETLVLRDFILNSHEKKFVCALGGGTIISSTNLELIKSNGTLIYINTDIKTLISRLKNQKQKRPLIKETKSDQELEDLLTKIYNSRKDKYNLCDYKFDNDKNDINFITNEIKKKLKL